MKRLALGFASTAVVVVVGYLLWSGHQREKVLEQKAATLHEVCSLVKAALWNDRNELKKYPQRRLQVLERINGQGMGDGAQMLIWCLPRPFEADKFDECRQRADDTCIAEILKAAEDSIE